MNVAALEHVESLGIYELTLLVHHLVVLQSVLTYAEVTSLYGLLRVLYGVAEHPGLEAFVVVHERRIYALESFAAETLYKVVLERDEEYRCAHVALTARTAAELVVDTARFVPFGAEYAQTACLDDLYLFGIGFSLELGIELGIAVPCLLLLLGELSVRIGDGDLYHVVFVALFPHSLLCEVFGVAAEQNISTTACHVGSDCHRAVPACLCDYLGFSFVVLCVKDVVLYAVSSEKSGNLFRLIDGYRTDEHGLTYGVALCHFLDYGLFLALDGCENLVGLVNSLNGLVGGNDDDVERVYRAELRLLGLCRTRHARELGVEPEVVLEGDGCVRLVLLPYLYVLLCLDCLVESVGISSADHQTARELVDYHYLAVLGDDVVLVPLEQLVRLERLLNVMVEVCVFDVAEVIDIEELFGLFRTEFGYGHRLVLAVDDVVPVFHVLADGFELAVNFLLFGSKGLSLLLADGRLCLRLLLVVVEAAVKRPYESVHILVELGAFAALARDYEGRPRLVD